MKQILLNTSAGFAKQFGIILIQRACFPHPNPGLGFARRRRAWPTYHAHSHDRGEVTTLYSCSHSLLNRSVGRSSLRPLVCFHRCKPVKPVCRDSGSTTATERPENFNCWWEKNSKSYTLTACARLKIQLVAFGLFRRFKIYFFMNIMKAFRLRFGK